MKTNILVIMVNHYQSRQKSPFVATRGLLEVFNASGDLKITLVILNKNYLLPSFLRTHRSYIVNKEKTTAFTAQDIEIGGIEIPISISYKQHVLEVLKQS